MISLVWAAALWFRDVRRIGAELERQERELRDLYGLEHNELRPLPLWSTHPHHKDLDLR